MADSIKAFTQYTAIVGLNKITGASQQDTSGLRLAWRTHYPGDVRALYNTILESYQLKTLDVLAELPVSPEWKVTNSSIAGQTHLRRASVFLNSTTGRYHFFVQRWYPSLLNASIEIEPELHKCLQDLQQQFGGTIGDAKHMYIALWHHPPLQDNPLHSGACGRIRFSEPGYDRIIACTGWKSKIPKSRAGLIEGQNEKYPTMTPQFGSAAVPGLYFAGVRRGDSTSASRVLYICVSYLVFYLGNHARKRLSISVGWFCSWISLSD